jgi:hypothetical protein
MENKDRSLILRAIGGIAIVAGIGVGLLAPIEIYAFYLFSEGGQFYYEGFGIGALMFGNIAAQIIGYYLIAALLIPLGYGHLKLRRWARTLALTALGFWLVVGLVVAVLFLLVLVTSKEPTLASVLFFAALLALSYLVLPALMIRFYGSRDVRATFEAHDPYPHWTEERPVPVLVLAFLCAFFAVCMHIPILFSGIFPLFGTWLFDLPGIVLLALSMACLGCLAWGVLGRRTWAWWGTFVYLSTMIVSTVLTLLTTTWSDILAGMRFPITEMEAVQGMPLQGYHIALFLGIPLLASLGLVLYSKRYFGQSTVQDARSGRD